ncbi:hypothetical protein M0C34_07570 [Agarivorans sp. TSD2052]|uniref:hypothetical protein n=1 Tax=Agarivorans sp. TSD2052 TaxID=2937286 RepID=UPI00200C3D43|nr:hypothetical protein [Agarivorans sp. TSD2052]UPW20110.1 hypothetical protein M0C34_07570 [Agarivorans sp. TSD2052]
MSKWKLQHFKSRKTSPISYWIHKGVNEEETGYSWCTEYEPPFPEKDPTKGYPYLTVSVQGFEIEFASLLEIEHFLSVMEQKNLPTTLALSELRGTGYGPNNHWLSRFPAHLKSWVKREKIITAVKKAKTSVEVSGNDF